MGAKAMLKNKRPKIFWSSCATHTINLMVEAIGKLKQFGPVIAKAKELTIFLYAHHATLSLMRLYTKKRHC
jgi:selenocysteine lyase/cysteine desulfurase